ncbi:MAG: copper resistance protein NlpE [Flavobacterium sp.]
MKKLIFVLICLTFISCKKENEKPQTEEEKYNIIVDQADEINSKSMSGTYSGMIPCADCEGIAVLMTLKDDKTYSLETLYLGKEKNQKENQKGTYKIKSDLLILDISDAPNQYRIGENYLLQLDMEGQEITGETAKMYKLVKN